MNIKKNFTLVISLVAVCIVWAEAAFGILNSMVILNSYTLIVFLKGLALLGIFYVIYLYYTHDKKSWALTLIITTLWAHASIAGGSTSILPMVLNVVAVGVLIGTIGKSLK